jgi:hypothetical protein
MNKFLSVIIFCYCGFVLSLNDQASFTYEMKNTSTPAVFRAASEGDCCLNGASCCPVGYYCCPGSAYCCASRTGDCCSIGTGWNDSGSGKNSDCCYGWSCSSVITSDHSQPCRRFFKIKLFAEWFGIDSSCGGRCVGIAVRLLFLLLSVCFPISKHEE